MSRWTTLVESFSGRRLAVLGDMVLDYYLYGTTDRISREAPVLVVRQERLEARLGGAANVAANIKAMGGVPLVVGLCGDDQAGRQLRDLLKASGIGSEGLVCERGRVTVTKTRILAGGTNTVRQQMLRIDRLSGAAVRKESEERLMGRLAEVLADAEALLVSDYGEGVLSERIFSRVLRICRSGKMPVFVDARRGIERYVSAAALTPNQPELSAACGRELLHQSELEEGGRWLLKRTGAGCVLLKRGRNGMALFCKGRKTEFIPAFGSQEVADVTGAGDTVLAVFALARAAGASLSQAMLLANTAGGIKVTKAGTAVVTAAEIAGALARGE